MLSLFPQILFLAPLGTTILRVAVALTFLAIAYIHIQRRGEIEQMRVPLIGRFGSWIYFSIVIEAVIGMALLIGYAVQVTALLAMIVCIKQAVFAKRFPRAIPLCRLEYVFMALICLDLVLTGAGAFAFDLSL